MYVVISLPTLHRDKHIKFCMKGLRNLPSAFEVSHQLIKFTIFFQTKFYYSSLAVLRLESTVDLLLDSTFTLFARR